MYAIGQSARRGFAENYAYMEGGGVSGSVDELALADPRLAYQAGFGIVPAVVVPLAQAGISMIRSSAAGPNQNAATAVYPEAAAGNLAGVAAFITRADIQTVTSAAPWKAGLAQLEQDHPEWVTQARPLASWATYGAIPPEMVLPAVMAHAKYVGAGGVPGSPSQVATGGAGGPVTLAGIIPGGPLGLVLGLGLLFMVLRGRPRGRR